MKLISLNVFGGTFFEPLMQFIAGHAQDTDIFCFQEMQYTDEPITECMGARANLYQEISAMLPGFTSYFSPVQHHFVPAGFPPEDIHFGMAIFIRKGYGETFGQFFMNGHRDSLVQGDQFSMPTMVQHVTFNTNGLSLTVCNVHGIAWPGDKLDSPIRLEQTRKILAFVSSQEGEKIVCGDFNLLPNTRSIEQFEENGMRNLIKDYKITTTRGTLNKQLNPQYANSEHGFQEFADYTFVTPGISVTGFEVPDLPVSDHLPMVVEFEVNSPR